MGFSLFLIFLAGTVASAINSVAGGGSLISFPTLIGLGIPGMTEVTANATNSVGLWPGSLSSAFGFSNVFSKTKRYFLPLLGPTVAGSVFGAWLLVHTSNAAFRIAVPVLIFLATMLLAFQPQIRGLASSEHRRRPIGLGIAPQFLVSIYGGYFGAGMGIMMLAVFAIFMEGNIHELNAVKAWLGLVINFVASIAIILQGLMLQNASARVMPLEGAVLAVGAVIGGFAAARYSQRVDADKLRKAIVLLGFLLTCWFTYRVLG